MPDIPRDYNPHHDSSATAKQPAPTGNGQVVGLAVISDIAERMKVGEAKYGTMLRTQNGRDPLVDAYQEVLDLAQYIKQEILNRQQDVHIEPPKFSPSGLLAESDFVRLQYLNVPFVLRVKIRCLQAFALRFAK